MNFKHLILAAGSALALSSGAHASVVVDRSVDVVGLNFTFPASNYATLQNFLVRFTLGADTVLGGSDIYSKTAGYVHEAAVGDQVLIKFRIDNDGLPALSNLLTFSSMLSAVDSDGASTNPSIQRLHADFTSTLFRAGTYWFGMSGSAFDDIGWTMDENNINTLGAVRLQGDKLDRILDSHTTLAYRLDGPAAIPEPAPGVPEPATWTLMIGGFGVVGATLRGRRKVIGA